MSRRIIRRTSQLLAQKQQLRKLQQLRVRTFAHEKSLQMLSNKSCFLRIMMQSHVKQQLLRICKFAAYRRLVYLTDIQVQSFFRFFVIHKRAIQNKWYDQSYSDYKDYDLYINPQITKYEGQCIQVSQQCHSFPFIKSLSQRSSIITANYSKVTNLYDVKTKIPQVKDLVQNFTGFKAILFQHCMDHLQGKHFFMPTVSKGKLTFQTTGNYFKNTKFLIKQYNIRVKRALQQNKIQIEQFKKTQKDYQQRIRKAFADQSPAAQSYASSLRQKR